MRTVMDTVAGALGVASHRIRSPRPGEVAIDVHPADLPAFADAAAAGLDGRLLSLFATDERARYGRFVIHQIWSLCKLETFLCMSAPIDPVDPGFPSIAAKHPAATTSISESQSASS